MTRNKNSRRNGNLHWNSEERLEKEIRELNEEKERLVTEIGDLSEVKKDEDPSRSLMDQERSNGEDVEIVRSNISMKKMQLRDEEEKVGDFSGVKTDLGISNGHEVEEIEIEVGNLKKEIEDAFLDAKKRRDTEINKLRSALDLLNDDLKLSFQESVIRKLEIQKELELKAEFKKIEALMSDHAKAKEKLNENAEIMLSHSTMLREDAEMLRQNTQIMKKNSEKLVARELEIEVLHEEIEVLRKEIEVQNLDKELGKVE